MTLPDCLTKLDATAFAEIACKPKRFYEVILSRPVRAVQVTETMVGVWSGIPATRRLLTREGLAEYLDMGFLASILREFDEVPK